MLVLDYDRALHHECRLWDDARGPYLEAPDRYCLFQHAGLLADLLEPHPAVRIVLSTSWTQKLGFKEAVRRLPKSLLTRVIGATYEFAEPGDHFAHLSRREQVLTTPS